MMGRAGRPQFDTEGISCVFVHDQKKDFYKKFLYDPFPVESSLLTKLHDHINAEIVTGSIKTKQEAIDYLSWTFLYRRLIVNPRYYDIADGSIAGIEQFLSKTVDKIARYVHVHVHITSSIQ